MNDNELLILLAIISSLTALNLALNVKLIRHFLHHEEAPMQRIIEDEEFPVLTATQLSSDAPLAIPRQHVDTAAVFLQTNCPKCKSKLPMLEQMILRSDDANVTIQILVHDQMPKLDKFFQSSSLQPHIAVLSYQDYLRINRHEVSPAYVFISEQKTIEAQGLVGDDGWRYFEDNVLGSA
ncbi:hypothetical protein OE749_13385 [Aestuariibacter sp. AA17]|uniref:Thioredoxin domain-containing protein n=1 Tax=Fluctibacter corallii TaxID=2984329 RepID=A0ABT3AAJ9_9ALTE|nr:hypothetical protein [Aestuariibacter sp. AA17]MCV2885685.1 hypothetical protein [Aestuariibacter sp. AA17]